MKSRKIRTFIPEDKSLYANPYISFPTERNINNTKSSFELRYNKNYKVNSKRVFTISSEYRDIDRAIKPDLLHPSTLDRILTMENQDGTTACADLLNQTDKKYQHKRSKPKKHYYAVTKTATIAADIGIPTSEEAKVTKVLATSPMQLEKMLFKDYYGTRVGRKNSPPELHMIYNFDNWLQVRVCKEDPDKVVGRTIYYYNPSEMRPLEMNAFAKTIWTQKSVYVPVRFGTDVVPLQPSSSSTAITTPVDVNASLQDWQKGFEDKIFGRLNELSSQYQQAQQYVYNDDDSGYTFEEIPESMNVSYKPSQKGSVTGVTGGVDLKVNTVRNLLKKIWRGKSSYSAKVDSFLDICKKKDWDPDKVLDVGKIKNTKDLNDNDKEVIRLICNSYYRDYDTKWWDLVRTGAELRRPEKTGAQPMPNIQPAQPTVQQPTVPTVPTGVTVPPQNETVSLDQQQAQQPVQQQAQTPEQAQSAQSVFTDQQQPTEQQPNEQQPTEQQPDEQQEQNMDDIFDEISNNAELMNIFKDFLQSQYPRLYRGEDKIATINKIYRETYETRKELLRKFVDCLKKIPNPDDILRNITSRLTLNVNEDI